MTIRVFFGSATRYDGDWDVCDAWDSRDEEQTGGRGLPPGGALAGNFLLRFVLDACQVIYCV